MASGSNLRTGAGVLLIAALQILVGVILLGLYEAYKVKFINDDMDTQMEGFRNMSRLHRAEMDNFTRAAQKQQAGQQGQLPQGQGPLPTGQQGIPGQMPPGRFFLASEDDMAASVRPQLATPLDFIFYLSIVNNVFCLLGMAGVFNHQRLLVITYFIYNAAQVVVTFHYFVDACADVGVHYEGGKGKTIGYERAAAAFLFINFALSLCAGALALRAVDEIRTKNREEYHRMAMMTDTLNFEADNSNGRSTTGLV